MEDKFDEESVIGFDALYDSMMKTRKGVLWKDSVASYYHRGVERTDKLCKQLHDGSYKASPPKHFTITSPKKREIASISYRDRIYQRSLNDNVIYPVMTNGFIYDNFACQKGKGTDPARERLTEFLRKYYRKNGVNGYVCQIDIHGYYPNMKHTVVEKNFREHLPEWAFKRTAKILKEQYDGNIGYNPGSQLIQIAGISLLNGLDHFIKEKLHIRFYIRYMDDLILIHQSRDYLKGCLEQIKEKLAEIGFETNPNKTRIYEIRKGIMFLGFLFKLTDTGKVIRTADPVKVKTARKKYRRLVAKAKHGECLKESVDASFQTYVDHLSKGNSWQLVNRLQKYYNKLWEGTENDSEKTDA